MQLAEQGKIDLNADISNYLPADFLKLKYNNPITMLDLMNHTAGFEDSQLELFGTKEEELTDLEAYLKKNQPKQIYEPGKIISYSNYSTSLAGLIIERISGEKWVDYIKNHIFVPAGMENTTAFASLEDRPDLLAAKSQGIVMMGTTIQPMEAVKTLHLYPAGCINGTVNDLLKYGMTFAAPDTGAPILFDKKETLAEMENFSFKGDEAIMGNMHGFWQLPTKEKVISHGGGTIGFSTQLVIAPEEEIVIAVLTNSPMGTKFCVEITNIIFNPLNIEKENTVLPDTSEVNGHYIKSRRNDSSYEKIFPAFAKVEVENLNEEEIAVKTAGTTCIYEQVQPYVYQWKEGNNEALAQFFPVMKFVKDQGEITAMRSGYTFDYVRAPFLFQPIAIGLTSIGIITGIVYFIFGPVFLGIRKLIRRFRRKKLTIPVNEADKAFHIILALGSLMVWNSLILIVRHFFNFMTFPIASANVHLCLNSVFVLSGYVSLLFAIKGKKTKGLKNQSLFQVVTSIMFITTSILLIIWRFLF